MRKVFINECSKQDTANRNSILEYSACFAEHHAYIEDHHTEKHSQSTGELQTANYASTGDSDEANNRLVYAV